MKTPLLTAEVVRQVSSLAGLELSLERALELIAGLEPIFKGDAEIARLELGSLSPIGTAWPGNEYG